MKGRERERERKGEQEMVMHMKVAGWENKNIYNISGLAFGKEEVRGRVPGELKPFNQRAYRVGFAARWDQEKQPDFYMDLIELYNAKKAENTILTISEYIVIC